MTSGRSPLAIRLAVTGRRHTIALEGEVDLAGAPEVNAVIAGVCAGEPRTIAIDLRKVTFIDSTGLHSLLSAHRICREQGHKLHIIPGPANVRRLFELTGTTDFLPFTNGDSASAEADRALSQPAAAGT